MPWSAVCFHAQQAAEKYLKAFLVSKADHVERTHDLEVLLQQGSRHDPAVLSLLSECDALTAYAVDSRYPDMLAGDSEKLARDAVRMSDTICTAIRQRLGV